MQDYWDYLLLLYMGYRTLAKPSKGTQAHQLGSPLVLDL